ncbi:MAG: hydroxymethylglutaryl-CoA reductase [Armatimonadetes bacterium]|nr:hydroxymethylglutaryl-CoA reductase [Armatimonadota bacterium]
MPVTKGLSQTIIDTIMDGKSLEEVTTRLKARSPCEEPLPHGIPREAVSTREAQEKRLEVLGNQGIHFEYLTGKRNIEDPSAFQGNVENYIGIAQIPVGVIGPLRVNGVYAHGDFYVPLATHEGALVASHNRGAKLLSLSGGVRVMCLTERVSRAPGFIFSDMTEAGVFITWCVSRFETFRDTAKTTTAHGLLEDMRVTLEGNHVYLIFEYSTGDAAGQNMATIATEAICREIVSESPIKPAHWFVESNMSGDKKATALSYLYVRGKKVTAEAVIPRTLFSRILHTTPEKLMEYWKMSFAGGVQSGSIGVQGHYANALAALFIACGQDAACVSEASVGITRVDITQKGELYISVSLPNLIVGTVGGGTGLPTQRECLRMLGCVGEGTARKFAEICAATVLAGEISIMGALASGDFTKAHIRYGRKRA